MSSSLHTVARDNLVAAWSDPSVASVASIPAGVWPSRVLKGDRSGFISELHRGRLPAVEVYQVDDTWKALGDLDLGIVTSKWGIRVHTAAVGQVTGEELARAIAYAGLIVARSNPYFKIGDETIANFGESPVGYSIEIQFNVQNAMDRATYETTVTPGSGTPSDGGIVGGIRKQISFNDISPVAVLALPAGQALDSVEIITVTPFNDGSATVAVGTSGSPQAYMAVGDVDLTTTNVSYEKAASDTGPLTINVYVTPGASTQGAFIVQITTTLAS